MQSRFFYVTTTLPYVNAKPHLGHALELVQADVCARWARSQGKEVVFNFGVDEHGLKIYKKAIEQGMDPQAYCDSMVSHFRDLVEKFDVSVTNFVRTTDPSHQKAAQEFWRLCLANGDIYKKKYQAKYCVGCEEEKTDSELQNDRCIIHPNLEIELIDEENYFFAFSKYQDALIAYYDEHEDFIVPSHRQKEIRNFVAAGLRDFSISRVAAKMPWGVPVPGDDTQVMYVWFDALVNYISTLGWPDHLDQFNQYWPGIQFAGKDNLRPQTAMWQAMLMSAGLAPSTRVIIHGYITSNGQKMSKSLGNVVDPIELCQVRGVDAARYYLLREVPTLDDGDFSWERFNVRYEADLANTLGNLVSRTATLASKYSVSCSGGELIGDFDKEQFKHYLQAYRYADAIELLWKVLRACNEYIDTHKPWSKESANRDEVIRNVICTLVGVAGHLDIFLPQTAKKILDVFADEYVRESIVLFPK